MIFLVIVLVKALVRLRAKRGRCAEENTAVRAVCLPQPQHRLQPGVACEICGYGKEKQGTLKNIIFMETLTVLK